MPDIVPVRRALISVSDKTGLAEFARTLVRHGIEIISTGGTADALREAGLVVVDVSEVTGFPEILDGRVKTLHPKIHGGLLAVRDNRDHQRVQAELGIAGIDLLVVNLYPFETMVARGASWLETLENIDIGGPAMIRAAAKNHAGVVVVIDPEDYRAVLDELSAHDGATTLATRRLFAARAYARTAAYDAAIAEWFAATGEADTPRYRNFAGRLVQPLRYGENPHQSAAFYRTAEKRPGVATGRQVQGKELSYNNINDTDAAFECVAEFPSGEAAAVAIVKHANPCGVAVAPTLVEAWEKALHCDPVSAFGGIVAANKPLDSVVARKIAELFVEVVIAPDADDEALMILSERKNLRVLLTGGMPDPAGVGPVVKSVAGGLLVQSRDGAELGPSDLKVVTRRSPTAAQLVDLLFAFKVAKHVKSNAIVYARDRATVGVGAGQMSRIDSVRIAAQKAADAAAAAGEKQSRTIGSVVASDAFFPFADGLLAAAEAGATAVIQPGGSMRDDEVIAAADKAGLAMVFTGVRHFRH